MNSPLLYGLNSLENPPPIKQVHITGAVMVKIWNVFEVLSFWHIKYIYQLDASKYKKSKKLREIKLAGYKFKTCIYTGFSTSIFLLT